MDNDEIYNNLKSQMDKMIDNTDWSKSIWYMTYVCNNCDIIYPVEIKSDSPNKITKCPHCGFNNKLEE